MLSLWVLRAPPRGHFQNCMFINLEKENLHLLGSKPTGLGELLKARVTFPLSCVLLKELLWTLKCRTYSENLVRSSRKTDFDICTCQGVSWVPDRLNSAQRKQSVQRGLLEEKVMPLLERKYKTEEQLGGQTETCLILERLRISLLQEGPMDHFPKKAEL